MELKVEHISKVYGSITVLEDISFVLERGQKVGLVGDNGIGKSTLFKIIAGLVEPDEGNIAFRKGTVVGYMPQDTSLVTDETIREYIQRVSGMKILEEQMEQSADAMIEYERRNGYAFDHRMNVTLAGFGLKNILNDRKVTSLSSGQKSKVFMAGVLLADPDILLLDEPTNNLDLPALIWLEDFLARSEFACMIVSHDRLFLDRVVRKIFEIHWYTRTLTITNGKYSEYLARRTKADARQIAEHEAQQEEIKRLTETAKAKKADALHGASFRGSDNDKFLRGFKRDRASKSGKVAKAIEKRIEQMDLVEKPIEKDVFRIHIQSIKVEGSREIALKEVSAGYEDGRFCIGPISMSIPYGSRMVILGLNGTGKSTLLKIISKELEPLAGETVIGKALVVGNLMQEHDNLPRKETLNDFLSRRARLTLQDIYALAARFGFKAEEIHKEIEFFSPGGRARILLALFSVLSVNVLLLDEPTNHLDLEALDALEEVITHYEGTIVLVSHDRYFLEKFRATDTYVLSEGALTRQESFKTYLESAEREAKRLISML